MEFYIFFVNVTEYQPDDDIKMSKHVATWKNIIVVQTVLILSVN